MALTWDSAFLPFVALLLAVGLVRLCELIWSARNLRRRKCRPLAERWVFPAMVVLHTAVIALPPIEVLGLGRPFVPPLAAAAGGVLALGVALRIWTLWTLGRAWSVRVAAPEPDRVATTGPYRFIRHPNYLAVILEIGALPLIHAAWISCLVLSALNIVLLARRIRTEEALLSSVPAWAATMSGRARLVPGLY